MQGCFIWVCVSGGFDCRRCPHHWLNGKCGKCGAWDADLLKERREHEDRRWQAAYDSAQAKRVAEERRRMEDADGVEEGPDGDDFLTTPKTG